MKCIKCGHVVEPEAPRTVEAELKGEHVSVEINAPQCLNCGEVVLLGKHVRAYHRAVSDAYRRKVGLLTIDEIDSLRRNLNMTLPAFADYVFVGIATLKRWRRGEIQTLALDRLVRLRADPAFVDETRAELARRLSDVASTEQCKDDAPDFTAEQLRGGLRQNRVTSTGSPSSTASTPIGIST